MAVPERSSIHADTGTAGHQIAERCLRSGEDCSVYLDTIEPVKGRRVQVDEELVNSAHEYVDYVRSRVAAGGELQIEQRFTLAALNPPFDAGGTGDAVLFYADAKTLEIVDFKNGMGVVDVEGNKQLRSYALGALLANQSLDVDMVRSTVVQPRASHKNGRIRSETFDVAELVEWTAELLNAMQRSRQAADEYALIGANTVLKDEWVEKWLQPGQCKFCPVEGSCPALKRDAMSVAALWFEPETGQPQIGNSALDTSPEALARDLDMLPLLEDWIKARRALAHSMAEAGETIPGYQLVDKIGNRKWIELEGETVDHALAVATGLEWTDLLVDPKLKSPAALEKLLGAKRKHLIEPFTVREVTGTNLVSQEKTTRPAAKSVAATYFEASE